jgi:Tol biopolymer transport system component
MRQRSIAAFATRLATCIGIVCSLLVALAIVVAAALPSGGEIAFMSTRELNVEIYLMDMSQRVLVNLTRTPDYGEFDPSWSPDGRQMVFSAQMESSFDLYVINIFRMDILAGGLTPLTDTLAVSVFPQWSPDGKQILFASDRDSYPAIYLMSADGDDVRQFTPDETFDRPAWSPDGQRIVYTSGVGGSTELHVMNADGSSALTENAVYDGAPAWSPDGEQIAFVSWRDQNAELYVMRADGSEPRRLTENPADDLWPAWSPDGEQIAFVSSRDGNFELYVMNADGSGVQRLTWNAAEDSEPVWRPVGF